MAIDPSILISATAGLSQGLQGIITGSQNKAQQKWSRDMYDLQRKDALADWQMQNEYNSPAQQMQRLQAAGLNPNLVYGSGTVANNAQQPRSSSVESYKPIPIQADFSQILGGIYDLKLKQAQTDNIEAQRRVIEQDAALRAAQTASVAATTSKTSIDTEKGQFDLTQAKRLADTSVNTAEANLRKINADIDYTLHQDERAQALNANTLAQGAEAILRSRSERATSEVQRRQLEEQIRNVKLDATLKELDAQLRKIGINPQDPMWIRILGRIVGDPQRIIDNLKPTSKELLEKADNWSKQNPNYFKNKKASGW